MLLELIIAMAMLSLLLLCCFELLISEIGYYHQTTIAANTDQNLNIALDFVCDQIAGGQSILFSGDTLTVDSNRIYIKNTVLRLNEDQQQIAKGIDHMEVVRQGQGSCYLVTLCAGEIRRTRMMSNIVN